jgi:hypothetical protein
MAVASVALLGVGAAPAFGSRARVYMPSRLVTGAECVVRVAIPRTYAPYVLIILQQRVDQRWLTRAKAISPPGHVARLGFRPQSHFAKLILRVLVVRGRHVFVVSPARSIAIQPGHGGGSSGLLAYRSAGGPPAGGLVQSAPTVSTQPSGQTVSAGQEARFSVGFVGAPTPTIQWQVAPSGGSFRNIPGATSDTLTLSDVAASSNGAKYRAVGINTAGSAASNTATLVVLGNVLEAGQTLSDGQHLTAQDNEFQLAMQTDGNLVLYNRFGRALWASSTEGNPGAYLANQLSDGNLVVYDTSGQPLWATYTEGNSGDLLRLENDGNLLVSSTSGHVLWQTGALDHSLFGGESLSGTASEYLVSPNQEFQLAMQTDGNLVLYNDFGRALWASHTEGNPGAYIATQASDGNVVIYNSLDQALWNTGTQGNPGDALQLQDDGNVVVYSAGGEPLWSAGSLQSSLLSGESLAGSWSQYLTAPNRDYQFVMQADGNLVLYNNSGRPLWASHTEGNPGAYLAMQSDGNLVVYSVSGQPLWSSGTAGNPGDALQLQSDGNAVIYSSGGTALWATNTGSGGGGGGGGGITRKTGRSLSYNPFAIPRLYGECTYWADQEFGRFTGGVYLNVLGPAYLWANEAQAGGWTVTATPEVDSVVVFPPGEDGADKEDGHVAWVEQVSGSKIYVSEMHAPEKGVEDHRWYTVTPNLRFILAP